MNIEKNKTNKQTNKHTNKQTNKQKQKTNKQTKKKQNKEKTNKQTNKQKQEERSECKKKEREVMVEEETQNQCTFFNSFFFFFFLEINSRNFAVLVKIKLVEADLRVVVDFVSVFLHVSVKLEKLVSVQSARAVFVKILFLRKEDEEY